MIFVIGTNMTEAHPVAATFVKNAVLAGAKLIVVDPRAQPWPTCGLHIQIKVGSDMAFLNGLMYVLITENLYDKEFVEARCSGIRGAQGKGPGISRRNGLPRSAASSAETIRNVARRLASVKPGMLIYTLGITEHTCGVNNVMSCANLQMLLGNVGMECGGVNPLRGQNNVQGACDMGALPNVFPGYQRVDNAEARAKFEKAWGVTVAAGQTGLMMPQMMDGLPSGKIKAFYIFGENLANTEPDIRHVEHCLESAEFLVCQDIFPTETTRFAHVILPAAAWSENDGTFTNSERRVNRVRTVSDPRDRPSRTGGYSKRSPSVWGMNGSPTAPRKSGTTRFPSSPPMAGIKYPASGMACSGPAPRRPSGHPDPSQGRFTCGLGLFIPVDWTPPAEVPDRHIPSS